MSLDLVLMGYVANAFGIKGYIKVKVQTEQFDSLLDYPKIYLAKDTSNSKEYEIEAASVAGNELNIKLVGVDDRDSAFLLKGYSIYVPREDFPDLGVDSEYYWVDLIGCKVINSSAVYFGVVSNLLETGANDVLVVILDGVTRMIPFVDQYVLSVDLSNKTILVDWELDY